MIILVTGNLGYIGSVLTKRLQDLGHEVVGYDIGYYEDCNVSNPHILDKQIKKDIRDINEEDVKNIDAVIHLAAMSNDPLGELNPQITRDINYHATIKLANICKENNVKKFIFASTQSMYGIADTTKYVKEDSNKNPVTEYAKSKWQAEIDLKKIADDRFCVTFFRPSTVFGPSPRLRSDIVYNNFLGSAYTRKNIIILSDGTPWRPVVYIDDVCDAFISALYSDTNKINKEAFNIGIYNGNFTVKDLALSAQKIIPDANISINTKKNFDERTYKVSFNKIFNILREHYKPKFNLINGGQKLLEFYKKNNFKLYDFEGEKTNRIQRLKKIFKNEI